MYVTDDIREKCFCNLEVKTVTANLLPLNVSGRTYLFPLHCSRTASETSLIECDVNEVLKRDVKKVLDRQLYLHIDL